MLPSGLEHWASIDIDHRILLYGPRLGRSYLVPRAQAHDAVFLRVVGLAAASRREALADPVEAVVHVRAELDQAPGQAPERMLCGLYRAAHRSRLVLSLRSGGRLLRHLAGAWATSQASRAIVSDMGRQLHATEKRLGFSDCYPRSLATAYLALRAGFRCKLVVGALAPTRKMHAWCTVAGALPYEPQPEHYLYQPLWSLELAP